jgi:signal peptidase I
MEASATVAPSAARPRAGRALGWAACGVAVLAALTVLVVGVGPRVLPYRTYAITGGSMEPTIPLGAEVFVRPVRADRLRVGDVITFHKPDDVSELVTHRIVAIHGGTMTTKGDANKQPDAWRIRAVGTGWRYAFSVPYLGYAVQLLATAAARFAVIALFALLFAGVGLRRLWRAPGREFVPALPSEKRAGQGRRERR